MELKRLVRPNIWNLTPYSCARQEYSGKGAKVMLDANENPYNAPLCRYPDPLQRELKEEVARVKGVDTESIFLGNGSDEAIDLVFRVFCQPGRDNVVAMTPTYGMYEVCAHINDVEYRQVRLRDDFSLDARRLLKASDGRTKAVFLCSPNNPTGNSLAREEVDIVLREFGGIVVMDEAYSDFSSQKPYREELPKHENLIVLNTMSKAWASAALRLGMAFASPEIVALMNKVKYPYNISLLSQKAALDMLREGEKMERWRSLILTERASLMEAFCELPLCRKLYPTDANFFLAKVTNASRIYHFLVERGVVVRDRSRVELCDECLRITVGTRDENDTLLGALRTYKE